MPIRLVKIDRKSYARWGDTKPVSFLERLGEPFIITNETYWNIADRASNYKQIAGTEIAYYCGMVEIIWKEPAWPIQLFRIKSKKIGEKG